MTDKPSRTARRAVDQRAAIDQLLRRLTPARIEDLDRRARFLTTPDGFPPGGGGGPRGSDVSRPTEQATIARVDAPAQPDPVGDQIRLVLAALSEAAGVLAPVRRWLDHLDAYGDQAAVRDHGGGGDCKCCDRVVAGTPADRLRGGYCDACRKAYDRWTVDQPVGSDPAAHRREFEAWRRDRLVDQPAMQPASAVTCGHRCCDRVTVHEHWHAPAVCPDCAVVEAAS